VVLDIEPDLTPSAIRLALRAIVRDQHPDKTGGVFKDVEQEDLFAEAKSLLDIIQGDGSANESSLVPVKDKPSELTKPEIEPKIQKSNYSEISDRHRDNAKVVISKVAKQRFMTRKYGGLSVGFLAFVLLVLEGPIGKLVEHFSTISPEVSIPIRLSFLTLLVLGAFLGVWAKFKEDKFVEQKTAMLSDSGIDRLLYRHDHQVFELDENIEKSVLNLSQLAYVIELELKISNRADSEAIAKSMVSRLQELDLVELHGSPYISPRYIVGEDFLENLGESRWGYYQVSWIQRGKWKIKKMTRTLKSKLGLEQSSED